MKTSEIDFVLPRELVTFGPTPFRGDARLMVVDRRDGSIQHRQFNELPVLLDGYEVWANDLKLLRGRIKLWRETGHLADVDLLRQLGPVGGKPRWLAMVYAGYDLLNDRWRWRMEDGLECRIVGRPSITVEGDQWELEFEREPDLEKLGKIILPPWVRAPLDREDEKRYEPVYASRGGGIFCPTAGISLTPAMVQKLAVKFLTLHLEFDHIRTIEADTVEEHATRLHAERYEIHDGIPSVDKPIAAIGTTVMKAMETYARTGELEGESDLYISPPFEFKRVRAFLTNWHLPKESLLALTCAFGGTELIMAAYAEAIRERYRWSDYGDSVLVIG